MNGEVAPLHQPVLASRGTNQSGVRLYNERLTLSLIRRHGSLAKAEIARLTALSPQTVSLIVKQLEADGLLRKERPLRGRVGQPSVPFSLNPKGAFSIGFKIGRRSADVILMDFLGRVLDRRRETYRYPACGHLLRFAAEGAKALAAGLDKSASSRIAGLGLATPHEIWNWPKETGAPPADREAWREFDMAAALAERLPWPVYVCNDTTAACAAELVFGEGGRLRDYLYLYIGSFVGGGVVLGGNLFVGRTGNAGALGSMLVPDGQGGTEQLIKAASIYVLEQDLERAGHDPSHLWRAPEAWTEPSPVIDAWIGKAAEALAIALTSATAVIDFETVIIDGALPPRVRTQLVGRVRAAVARLDRQGLEPVPVIPGSIGVNARAIGGACLPLLASFAQDREVLFKDVSHG